MRRPRWPISVRRSFTLVEMLTVVAIIALILGMALPGFTRMWEERKVAGALTTLHGVLTSTRAKALHGSERGLFFYVDPTTRRQMIIPIVPDPPNGDPTSHEYGVDCGPTPPASISDCITDLMTEHRFRTVEGDVYELPAPMRAAPRNIVDGDVWTEEDITHDRFNEPPASGTWPSGWARHRNFFAIIFGPDGRLVAGRDVIIHDIALRDPAGDPFPNPTGYRTQLHVGNPSQYYTPDTAYSGHLKDIGVSSSGSDTLYDVVVEADTGAGGTVNAINFTSVDGLLVYDESVLADIPYEVAQEFKRRYLLESGQPIYVSRLTGEVLQGPRGENE